METECAKESQHEDLVMEVQTIITCKYKLRTIGTKNYILNLTTDSIFLTLGGVEDGGGDGSFPSSSGSCKGF